MKMVIEEAINNLKESEYKIPVKFIDEVDE
jgi:hypothetical protein